MQIRKKNLLKSWKRKKDSYKARQKAEAAAKK